LYWNKKTYSDGQSSSVREYRQVLPGDKHSFTVSDLDPNASYSFQVSVTDKAITGVGVSGVKMDSTK